MLSVKQMKVVERAAQKKGIFQIDLMENAGKQIFKETKKLFDLTTHHIVIFCGVGINGGDGLVAARYLANECPVVILLFGEIDKFKDDAKINYEKVKDEITIVQIKNKEDLNHFHFQIKDLVLIDALLGTGIHGEVREPIKLGIDFFNSIRAQKIAIDVPSGINADTGEGSTYCNVDQIFTLHDYKLGLDKEKCTVLDIGLNE